MTAGAATRPTTWYLALFTAAPSDTGGGTEVGAGVGYARQSITFSAASGGATANTNTLTFGPCTTSNWGTVTHAAIFDASSGGNMLWWGALSASRTVNVGDSLQIAIGDLDLALD